MKDLVGKQVTTKFGTAIAKQFISSLNCLHIVYPDGSMGWVTEEQLTGNTI